LDKFGLIGGVPNTEVVAFTRQFSTMVSAGLPISRALEVLGTQASNANLKKILMEILRDIEGGSSLSLAMGRHPNVFPPTYQALVRAGEASGKLDEILKRLATTMEKTRELNSKFKGAMIYPVIVFIAMIGVFIMMMIFVVPQLAGMYESLNVDLPAMTKAMIFLSDFIVENVILMAIAGVGAFLGLRYFMKTDSGKELMSNVMFAIPIFGKINKQKEITDFTRTLGLLMASAIPIVEALNIVAGVMNNKRYRDAAFEAAASVEKGNSLSEYIKSNEVFPPLIGQMVNVGEETGQLDEVLDRVANFLEGEVDHSVKGLSAALEPVILIMLGSMVGFLIIAIITPIYKITSSI
ncbi:type II secretion system F family protein, partial [Patescibacteria group bacterium]